MNHNQAHIRVYEALQNGSSQTQPELALATGLSLPAVIQAVQRLSQAKLLREAGLVQKQGRPAKRLCLTPEEHPILTIDLGGSSMRAALFDLHGKRLAELETISLFSFSKFSRRQALQHLQEIATHFPQAKQLGICTPGIVTPAQNLENSWLFNLKTLHQHELEQALQKPVRLENDARSAAWGELRRGHGSPDFAFMIFAFGIGAGIVLDGQLLRGRRGAAGEMSYLPPSYTDFQKPRLGALAYSFFEALKEVSPDPTAANWEARIFLRAENGKKKEARAVQKAVQHLALAIAGIITTLDPERIVLRQEFPHTQSLVLEPLQTMLGAMGLPTPLVLSALGRDAGLIGIGLLVAEALEQALLG